MNRRRRRVADPAEARMKTYLSLTEFAAAIGVAAGTMSKYKLPEADVMIGKTRGWSQETIDQWQANRPGKGAGAGREPGAASES
jgi:predicted DNA-binding transcriptional regulator AlpA